MISLKALLYEENSGLVDHPKVRELTDLCYGVIEKFFTRNKNKEVDNKYWDGYKPLFTKKLKTTDFNNKPVNFSLTLIGYKPKENRSQHSAEYSRQHGDSGRLKNITIFLLNDRPKNAVWKHELGDFFFGREAYVKKNVAHEVGHLVKDFLGFDYTKSKTRDRLMNRYEKQNDYAAYLMSGEEMETNMINVTHDIENLISHIPTTLYSLSSLLKMLPKNSTYKEIKDAFIDPKTKEFKSPVYEREFKRMLSKLVSWWKSHYPNKPVK